MPSASMYRRPAHQGRPLALALLGVLGAAGCGTLELPPPAAPPPTVPAIAEVPEAAPADGVGRLLVTSEGEPAKVARVIETEEGGPHPGAVRSRRAGPFQELFLPPAAPTRRTELLCIAPCAVDLRVGAHSLVFTSLRDPQRTSTVDIAVPKGTTVVRHALGSEKPATSGFILGRTAVLSGGALALFGGVTAAVNLAAEPEPGRLTTPGAILGGVGVLLVVTGIVLMTEHRAERRPGATTSFRVRETGRLDPP